ncbi:putative RlpA-like protein double-psi beta-barrel domain-containing protein [Seiridium cardinale]
MKSATVAVAVLASVAIAQPHGHARRHQHDRRDLVVEWVTVEETVTVEVDEATTQTFYPSKTPEVVATSSGSPGQFFQAASSSSSPYSVAAPSTTLIAQPSTEKTIAPAPTTTSTTAPVVAPSSTTETSAPVETTTYAAPASSTAETSAPVETTTYAAPASSTTAASTGGSSGGSGTNVKSSDMTYYPIGLGSCGYDDAGLDMTKPVVAVDSKLWDSVSTATSYGLDQPAHPFCNQEVTIMYNGHNATGIVRDRCGGCVPNAVDVAEMIFDDLVGGTGAGRVSVEWFFNSGKW